MSSLLVAVEGLDGAGKSTQVSLLASALSAVDVVSFPRYDTFFGRRIRELLDGVGDVSAQTVDPRSMALWYALDRVQWARDRKPASDGVVLLNRYVLSNAVYQSARAGDPALFDWVLRLEFEELELPRPDVTVVLDVPPEVSKTRVAHRGDADLYERSASLLARVREGYLTAASRASDVVVVSAAGSPESVHADVLRALAPFLSGPAARRAGR
jgi:dTMP kinase